MAHTNWDRACEDLKDGFPLDCTGMMCIEQEEEARTQAEEEGDTQKCPPPPKAFGTGAGGGRGAHQL